MPRKAGFKEPCKFDGCERERHGLGYCHAHYVQVRRGKGMAPIRAHAGRPARTVHTCRGPDCDLPVLAKGYCPAHYRQNHKGQPLQPLNGAL